MNKKAIILRTNEGLITDLIEIKTFTNETEFINLEKKAKENKEELIAKENKIKELNDDWFISNVSLLNIENEILRNHIKALIGEIDEETCTTNNDKLESEKTTIKERLEQLTKERNYYGLE